MKKYLGLDIGTTSLKAAVFDENGQRLGLERVDYTLDTDAKTGFIEFDPEKYITMCREVIDRLSEECGPIEALSIDTQGETLILTDAAGKPVCPAIVWLDNRATAQAEEIEKEFGHKKVYDITGQPEITATWPASKLLWVKENRPEVFAKTEKIFMLEDWVLYRLTGNFVTEPTIQSSSVYFDINTRTWWGEMLEFIGIKEAMLPKVCRSAEAVGTYKGITVVSGALDQIAGTIGVGVTDETRVSEMTGTIMAVCATCDTIPPYDPKSIVPCHLHAIDDKFCLILWSATAGMALKWFKEQFGGDLSFKELDALAEKVAPGCDGMTMLPYFCGSTIPNYNPDATATFAGITLSHTRGHFARSIMEAVAFMLRGSLEYANVKDDCELRITGGAASSPLWAGIKANVVNRVLNTVSESETACLGTAILAMVGVGQYASIKEATEHTVRVDKTYSPTGDDYEAAYQKYCELDNKLNIKE